MSDNSKYYTKEEKQLIAAAAIASTPPTSDMTEATWQRAVIRRAATIDRLRFLREGSLMMNVLSAVRIRATVKSVVFEESSKRYVITYTPTFGEDAKDETIRTPRSDTYDGELLAQDIERLKSYAGTDKKVVIFKHNEVPSEAKMNEARAQGKIAPTAGYRQAVWFEFLD